jgi:diaminopimelate decarboxylase
MTLVSARPSASTGELAHNGPPTMSRSEIEHIQRLLPYLSYPDGELALDGVPAQRLWDGTRPLLVYLPERAVDNYRAVRAAFSRYFDVSVYCAIKCCYLAGVLSALRAAGAGAEINSDLEWRIARKTGFSPQQIVSNAVARPAQHLETLIAEKTALIGVDGEEELDRTEWHARHLGVTPGILIRVNPLPPDPFFSDRSKLGTDWDDAFRLLERAAASRHLDVRGVHAHQLVRCADAGQFGELARRTGEFAAAFSTASGRHLDIIDLGGGLESRFLMERDGLTIEEFAAAARDALGCLPSGIRLVLEPGRFIFADAALALTGILGTRRKTGSCWLITDAACNLLRPTSDRTYPPLPLRLTDGHHWSRCHVADPTCAPTRLWLDALLPQDAAEHGLALIGCGAYTMVRSSVWGTDLPDIGLLRDGRIDIVFDHAGQDAMVRSLYGVGLGDSADGS